ncbi:MAG: HupE/UreJ family protein [Acidimicrobiia bacterium]
MSVEPSPILGPADQPRIELVGGGCKRTSEGASASTSRRAVYRCNDPSTPLRVELTYPNDNPSLPTLLDVTRADGTVLRITASPGTRSIIVSERQSQALRAQAYASIGFDHILRGFDHLLFLSFLWLVTGTGWILLRALTGFTLGHSVTLALAATGVATPPAAFIESMIALSIVLMAADSLKSTRTTLTLRHPALVATLFGLLHGFGFAGYLREIGLPKNDELAALLMFNIGVELGQIAFVLALISIGVMIKKATSSFHAVPPKEKIRAAATYAGGIIAAYWFAQRLWDGLHPLASVG